MKLPFALSLVALSLLCASVPSAKAQHVESTVPPDDYFIMSERESGFWLSADALLWKRNNPGGGSNIIGGPEALNFSDGKFQFEGGYRLGLGWLIDPNYEVEGVWTQYGRWSATNTGVLTRGISFDGGQASLIVDPTGNANFVNTSTFFRPLFDAATYIPSVLPNPNDETTEFEFMQPGLAYTLRRSSDMSDGQVNFKTRRTEGRRFSFGLGYRHISLSEAAVVGITGTFDAFDIDGDEAGVDGPNDQLSDEALSAQDLALLSGGGGFNDPTLGGGAFTMLWAGATDNQLNGLQGVLDGSIFERGRFALDGNLRAGLYLNRVRGTVVEQYSQAGGSVYGRSFADDTDRASFAANVGLSGSIRLAEQFYFRTGYEVMFVTNVGMAPTQQQGVVYDALGNASYSVQTGDTIVLHGLRAGFEYQW
ncbi:MAG: hypothetical protein AABP62_21640 [Planctomycetota bacterium]